MSLRFVLIGHPVGHSLSPVIHRAAYEEFGLDHRYELMDVENEAGVKAVVDELRSGRIAGLNATIPHKRAILALADEATDAARRIGAANVLERRADGRQGGHGDGGSDERKGPLRTHPGTSVRWCGGCA